DRSWPRSPLRIGPNYVLAAGLAAALIELLRHSRWDLMPVAAVLLACAYRAYASDVMRLEHEYRQREVLAAIDHGMSVVDGAGRVTLWNDALERITGCPRERAIGRSLVSVLPALGRTPLPAAVTEALANAVSRTVGQVALPSGAAFKTFEIKIVPVADGLTLLWHDTTERARAEQALKRSEEPLSLAANRANDGLRGLDLGRQSFSGAARGRAMVGLSQEAAVARGGDWVDRVHPEAVTSLRAAIEAHVAGTTPHVHHEHRIRHEDGTYRRFLCHGVAA